MVWDLCGFLFISISPTRKRYVHFIDVKMERGAIHFIRKHIPNIKNPSDFHKYTIHFVTLSPSWSNHEFFTFKWRGCGISWIPRSLLAHKPAHKTTQSVHIVILHEAYLQRKKSPVSLMVTYGDAEGCGKGGYWFIFTLLLCLGFCPTFRDHFPSKYTPPPSPPLSFAPYSVWPHE